MKNIFILDDDANRHNLFKVALKTHKLFHAWNSTEANSLINGFSGEPRFEVIFLDHDLGEFDEPSLGTGLHVAKNMVGMRAERRPDLVVVHSHNPDGTAQMVDILRADGFNVERQPFCERLLKAISRW